jgi:phenylacetate-CoA ligase
MKGQLTYRLFDLLARRRVMPTLARLLERQTLRPAVAKEEVQRRLSLLLNHAARAVPFYRERARILDRASLSSFPVVGKDDLGDPRPFLAEGADPRRMERRASGGSTGAPVVLLFDRAILDAQTAATLRFLIWMDLDLVCPHLLLWGPPPGVVSYGRFSGRLRGMLLRRRFVPTFAWKEDSVRRVRASLQRACPPLIVGYSSALDVLAAGAAPVTKPPRAVVAAAEILYPAQRRRIERFFGAPVYERYGSNEFGALAHQCRQGSLHVIADRVVFEILRPDGTPVEHGAIGEAVITDLDNFGMPLIRYRLGDAVEAGGTCGCSLPFATIAAVHGRMADLLPGADGRPVSPRQVSIALAPSGEVLEHQVRVADDGTIEVRVRAIGDVNREVAAASLQVLFGRPVTMTKADQLERWPSGKVRPVVNEGQRR